MSALLTDEYCLTMAQTFYQHNQNETTVFEMFVRKLPEDYGFAVFAGLSEVLENIENFCFTEEDIQFLKTQKQNPADLKSQTPLYTQEFLEYLKTIKFTGQVYAMDEGTIFFPSEPILQIVAPRIEATLLEPMILKIINRQSALTTKAARIKLAAKNIPVWDFSLRRDGGDALETAKASYIGGMEGSAVPLAGQKLGIPTTGTMAHQYIQMFSEKDEQKAYEQWLINYPERSSLLVDTFNTRKGIQKAIKASQKTKTNIKAIRLDSGDILADSIYAREQFKKHNMQTMIMATGDLDEYRLDELLCAGAQLDIVAAGTKLSNCPYFGGVYKLTAQNVKDETKRMVMKKSKGKISDPGQHQVFRTNKKDILALADEQIEGTPLLKLQYDKNTKTQKQPKLKELKNKIKQNIENLPNQLKEVVAVHNWPVERTEKLLSIHQQLGDQKCKL